MRASIGTLASPKLLALGFPQINLTFGLILSRLSKEYASTTLLSLLQNLGNHYSNSGFAEVTLARISANKFGKSLAYS